MKRGIFLLLLILGLTHAGNQQPSQPHWRWRGYLQARYFNDFEQVGGFSLRRVKLWMKGSVPHLPRWHYKIQALFHWYKKGAFTLQDAFGEYRWHRGWLRIGQMVPYFSLQRAQPDYRIPAVERAAIINALIPAAETMARDLGIQLHLHNREENLLFYAGAFNGSGANQPVQDRRHFLFTGRLVWQTMVKSDLQLHLGTSLAYREIHAAHFKKILGSDSEAFQGRDFRYGIEARLVWGSFFLQGEYIRAQLEQQVARGYYLLADYLLKERHQLVLSLEQYRDLNPNTRDVPRLLIGYNYLWHKHLAKWMTDVYLWQGSNKPQFLLITQIQLFFN